MSGEYTINQDVRDLANELARQLGQQNTLALVELREALAPAKKVRNEAAERTTVTTVALEQDSPGTPRPQQLVGRGITENRARVTVWCNTGAVVYLATDKGGLQSEQTRVQLIPLVPIVISSATEWFAASPDAGTARVSMIIEEFDAP